jgi:exosome complex component RRP41
MKDMKLINDDGTRIDGRRPEELRPIKIEAGVLNKADGSAYVEWGQNKILAAVYGPREVHPRHLQRPNRGIVQVRYNMAPFSVGDRKRPGPDRRSTEISKVISEAFTNVLFLNEFPRTSVDVYIEVLEANAGTRCAGITAASVALADAGIPMRDLIAASAAGKVDGTLVLDLGKEEDNHGEADLPMAVVPRTGEIVLLQMDGDLSPDELEKAMEMNLAACKTVYDLQREALRKKYAVKAEEETPEKKEEEEGGDIDD